MTLPGFATGLRLGSSILTHPKYKVLCISYKRSPLLYNYSINNVSLEWIDFFKYLGISINHHLSCSDHTAIASRKAFKILNLLRRSMYSCSKTSKMMAFTALVRPHLEYCAPVWSPHYAKDKATLERVQKRAAHRTCSKWDRDLHKWSKSYAQALNELNWLSVHQRHTLLICCQMYKIIQSLDCIDCNLYFSYASRISRHHSLALSCIHSRVNSFRYSFLLTPHFYGTASVVSVP